MEDALLMIKCHAVPRRDDIVEALKDSGVEVVTSVTATTTRALMQQFYQKHADEWYFERTVESTTGEVALLHVRCADIGATRKTVIGPTDPSRARRVARKTIRARFGAELPHNAVHMSDSPASGRRELELVRDLLAA